MTSDRWQRIEELSHTRDPIPTRGAILASELIQPKISRLMDRLPFSFGYSLECFVLALQILMEG